MAKKSSIGGSSSSIFDIISRVDDSAEVLAESKSAVIKDYIDTGSYILNAAMTGSVFKGAPTGRVVTLSGDPGCLEKSEKIEIYIINGLSKHHERFDENKMQK